MGDSMSDALRSVEKYGYPSRAKREGVELVIFKCPKCDNYTTTHDYLIEQTVQVHGLPDPDSAKEGE